MKRPGGLVVATKTGRLQFASLVVPVVLAMGTSLALAEAQCRAIDGDTLRCGAERVRLRNIYAAEKDEPGGQEAKANLQDWLDAGEIHVERRGKDKYGRTLGDVYIDGRKVVQADIGPRAGRGSQPVPAWLRSCGRAARTPGPEGEQRPGRRGLGPHCVLQERGADAG